MAKNSNAKAGKKLRGAVLSLVLIVMYVLLIMLMATLAVVSTAKNRSYSKFEENQAYYTARSAIDVFEANVLEDSSYVALNDSHGTRTFTYTDENGINQTVSMSQGFGMQMDLFSIKAHAKTMQEYEALADKENTFSADPYANPTNAHIDPTDPASSLYSDLSFGVVPTNNYIEYEITMPDTLADATLKKYGKYIEQASTTKATIRVEVLAREFNDIGNHKKDEMFVKITSKIPYQNTVGEVSRIVEISNPNEPEMFSNGITSFGAMTNIDNATIIGGLSTQNDVTFGNTGGVIGEMYCGGDIYLQGGGSCTTLAAGEATLCNGDFDAQNNFKYLTMDIASPPDPMETPIVYVTGDIDSASQFTWAGGYNATPEEKVTLICNNLITSGSQPYSINGDVIVLGNLVASSDSFKINGNVYVAGNMTIGDPLWSGTNISPAQFAGNYYVKGQVEVFDHDFANAPAVDMGNIHSPNAIKYHYPDPATGADMDDIFSNPCSFSYDFATKLSLTASVDPDEGAEITLPEVTGTNNIQACTYTRTIPVYSSAYSDYFTVSDTAPHDYISPREIQGASIVKIVPQDKRDIGKYEHPEEASGKTLDFYDPTNVCASGGYSALPTTGTVGVSGEQNFYLAGGNLNLKLTGSGIANIFLEPNGWYSGFIQSADAIQVNFLAAEGNYTWNVANYTDSVLAALQAGVIKAGDAPDALKPPSVYFYVDGNSTWNMTQAGWCLLTGYFYGPSTQLNGSKGLDTGMITGVSGYSYMYNGDYVKNDTGSNVTANPFCIGAMVVGGVSGLNNNAVITFLAPESIFTIPVINGAIAPIYSFDAYEHRAR